MATPKKPSPAKGKTTKAAPAKKPKRPAALPVKPVEQPPGRWRKATGPQPDAQGGKAIDPPPAAKPAVTKPIDPKPATVMGRPTLYEPRYAGMLVDYFNIEPTRTAFKEVVKDGKAVAVEVTVSCDLPTLAGFCCKIGVHRETLLNWSKTHPDFFDALKMAKEHQERILVSNGIQGFYDKTFAIFTAKNLINWRDKQDVAHDVVPGGELAKMLDRISGTKSALPIIANPDGEGDEPGA